MIKKDELKCPKSIFFCGASWGCLFYIGVYKALIERWGYECLENIKFGGNSSGALMATLFALGIDLNEAEEIYKFLSNKATNEGVFLKMTNYHNEVLNKVFIKGDEYKKLNNRLFIGVTYFYNNYKVISKWNSNQELLDILHASFHIPFYCTYTNNTKYGIGIDGCISKNFYMIDNETLVISCRNNDVDITCNPLLSFKDCIYPIINNYNLIYKKGYDVMLKWDGTYNNNKQNTTTKSNILIMLLWIFRYLEELKKIKYIFKIINYYIIKFVYYIKKNLIK